jgi:hypothetical protein
MSYDLDVRFLVQSAEVMIRFKDKEKAWAYKKKNSECRIVQAGEHRHEVYLPFPKRLEHIRASQTKHHLVFVFSDRDAAEAWSKRSIIGDLEGKYKEVWIKREWKENELNEKLGLNESDGSDNGDDEDDSDSDDNDDDVNKAHNSRSETRKRFKRKRSFFD